MEYPFISRETFDNLIEQYVENLAPNKKKKALIDQEKLQKIKEVLLNPENTTLYTSSFCYGKNLLELHFAVPFSLFSTSHFYLKTRTTPHFPIEEKHFQTAQTALATF